MKAKCEETKMEELLRTQSMFEYSKKGIISVSGLINIYGAPYFKLKSLDLSENEIADLPAEFYQALPNLESLCLQCNRLSFINYSISEMKSLTILKVDKNNLSCLPNSIGVLKHLEVLTASKNKMVAIPSSIGDIGTSLKSLNIAENSIQLLPSEMGTLTSLREFLIYHNKLITLPTSLYRLTKVTSFSFEWFRYTSPHLPTHVRDLMIKQIWNQLLSLFRGFSQNGIRELTFAAFVTAFSEEDFSINKIYSKGINLPKKYVGKSILQVALLEHDIGVVDALLPLKPDLDYVNNEGYSALGLALLEGHIGIARKILERGASVTIGHGNYNSLVNIAVNLFESDIILELISKGAKTDILSSNGSCALHVLFGNFDKFPIKAGAVADRILASGGDPNVQNINGFAPLHIAAEKNQVEALNWAFAYNKKHSSNKNAKLFDVNLQCSAGKYTPLHIASRMCNYKAIYCLLSARAQSLIPNAKNKLARKMCKGVATITKMFKRAEREEINEIFTDTSNKYNVIKTNTESILIGNHMEQSGNEEQIRKEDSVETVLDPTQKMWTRYSSLYKSIKESSCRSVLENFEKVENTGLKVDAIYGASLIGERALLESMWKKESMRFCVRKELYLDSQCSWVKP